jgi:hypothetical protein
MTGALAEPARLFQIVEEDLERRASKALLEKLRQTIVKCDADPACIAEMLRRVRALIRMFVDEGLAEVVTARLRHALGDQARPISG